MVEVSKHSLHQVELLNDLLNCLRSIFYSLRVYADGTRDYKSEADQASDTGGHRQRIHCQGLIVTGIDHGEITYIAAEDERRQFLDEELEKSRVLPFLERACSSDRDENVAVILLQATHWVRGTSKRLPVIGTYIGILESLVEDRLSTACFHSFLETYRWKNAEEEDEKEGSLAQTRRDENK